MFCQLDEHAAGRARMDEGDSFPFGANARGLVNQPNSDGPAASQCSVEVIDGETDMMESWTTLFEKPADRSIGVVGFEQLDEGVTGRNRGNGGAVSVIERNFRES
jgi:hypothetical protein